MRTWTGGHTDVEVEIFQKNLLCHFDLQFKYLRDINAAQDYERMQACQACLFQLKA